MGDRQPTSVCPAFFVWEGQEVLVVGYSDGTLELRDPNGAVRQTLSTKGAAVQAVLTAHHPLSNTTLLLAGDAQGYLTIFLKFKMWKRVQVVPSCITCMSLSQQSPGLLLAVADLSGTVAFFEDDVVTSKVRMEDVTALARPHNVTALTFALLKDSSGLQVEYVVAALGNRALQVLVRDQPLLALHTDFVVRAVAALPDNTVVVGGDDGYVCDVVDWQVQARTQLPYTVRRLCVWQEDGHSVVGCLTESAGLHCLARPDQVKFLTTADLVEQVVTSSTQRLAVLRSCATVHV
eukprot:m.183964 g.183964  ORF g.183964 m.183964 type:complete len:292 (+) comp21535_c0_seq2:5338-6213(+)